MFANNLHKDRLTLLIGYSGKGVVKWNARVPGHVRIMRLNQQWLTTRTPRVVILSQARSTIKAFCSPLNDSFQLLDTLCCAVCRSLHLTTGRCSESG